MKIIFPEVVSINELICNNPIQQIGQSKSQMEGIITPFKSKRISGFLYKPEGGGHEVIIVSKKKKIPRDFEWVLCANINPKRDFNDLSKGYWLKHHSIKSHPGKRYFSQEIKEVLESWDGAFSYVQEDIDHDVKGLRKPQIGAIHAIHAHWSVSEAPATIVMPTGTGKTEAMLSILISEKCNKLMVVVPTDALRFQLAVKFISLGILKDIGCNILNPQAKNPIVCTLRHLPASIQEVDKIFECSQVIVTTSAIAGKCNVRIQERMAHHCPYLFIDEAHHAEAPTWSKFKNRFRNRRIVQFTATPFREDGKLLDGDIIFNYPLIRAQEEGYFKPIRFEPVREFLPKRSDRTIAEKAIAQLRNDFDKGHILMARVDSISRAKEVFQFYAPYKEFNPEQLHTGIKSKRERDAIRKKIISGKSRIIICVDMLGEGFDLPELKIAAFHDIRKTLAVTLQLAGRFTRTRKNLGDATFIANIADLNVREELQKLYSRDPDWNALLPQLSQEMIGRQQAFHDFIEGFSKLPKEIPLKSIRPATSTVVYKTKCRNWTPEKFRLGIPEIKKCVQVHNTINPSEHTLVVVTVRREPLMWVDADSLYKWEWELFIVIWSPQNKLLFINGSSNSSNYRGLAMAVAGADVSLINGQDVFRAFSGVNRLCLQNVGLTERLGRNIRYVGRMGSDVAAGLSLPQKRHTQKSVLAGNGYESGEKTSIGVSRKGRIWTHRRDRIDQLKAWCEHIGKKLINEGIDPDEVLRGTLEPEVITERPKKVAINIDWPETIFTHSEISWEIKIGNQEYSLDKLSIIMAGKSLEEPLRFKIVAEKDKAEFELNFIKREEWNDFQFSSRSDQKVVISRGNSINQRNLADFLNDNPPMIWFSDGSSLEGNQYIVPKNVIPFYNKERIQAWSWDGIDLKKESQGEAKEKDSIQARVIRELLKTKEYLIIVDDDDAGEIADVVTICLPDTKNKGQQQIELEFYHCKYSEEQNAGKRIGDLYEVCGQAQKSILWMMSPEKKTEIFTHLLRREAARKEKGASTRFEKGDNDLLIKIKEMSNAYPIKLEIFIVQPGLSKSIASPEQLQLLSVTENYLKETYQIDFGVIASK